MEEIIGGAFRFIFHLLFEVVARIILDCIFYFPGYHISKCLTPKRREPSTAEILVASIFFWLTIGLISFFIYSNIGGASVPQPPTS